jgi:hypothetical protein
MYHRTILENGDGPARTPHYHPSTELYYPSAMNLARSSDDIPIVRRYFPSSKSLQPLGNQHSISLVTIALVDNQDAPTVVATMHSHH